VIPICVVVAAVTITLVLVLGKNDSSYEEIRETYQKISQEAREALENLEEFANLVQRIENAPAILQKRELSSRLNDKAQAMLGDLQGKTAPESLSGFSQGIHSLADNVDSTARQMTQTLQSGNGETFSTQASQLNSSISQVQQQLTADLSAAISNMSAGLSQKAQSVDSLLPQ